MGFIFEEEFIRRKEALLNDPQYNTSLTPQSQTSFWATADTIDDGRITAPVFTTNDNDSDISRNTRSLGLIGFDMYSIPTPRSYEPPPEPEAKTKTKTKTKPESRQTINDPFNERQPIDQENLQIESGQNDYVVYGKDVNGIVIYYITRSGITQTSVLPNPFYSDQVFGLFDLPKIRGNANYYLQSIFDKNTEYDTISHSIVPSGQYYLKEQRVPLMREKPISMDIKYDSISYMPPPHYDLRLNSDKLYYPVTVYGGMICMPYHSFLNSDQNTAVLPVTVIDKDFVKCFRSGVTLGTVRTELRATAGILTQMGIEYTSDYDELRSGLIYRLIRPSECVSTSGYTIREYASKYGDYLTKIVPGRPVILPHKPSSGPSPTPTIHSSLTDENILEGLKSYGNKPTPAIHTSMHFFHRVRFLQIKGNSIGSITDRIRKNLCIISGHQIENGNIMSEECFDEVVNQLYEALKQSDEWEKLLANQELVERLIQEPEKTEEVKHDGVFRTGTGTYKIEKFAYISPQVFQEDFKKIGSKFPALARKVEEFLTKSREIVC